MKQIKYKVNYIPMKHDPTINDIINNELIFSHSTIAEYKGFEIEVKGEVWKRSTMAGKSIYSRALIWCPSENRYLGHAYVENEHLTHENLAKLCEQVAKNPEKHEF